VIEPWTLKLAVTVVAAYGLGLVLQYAAARVVVARMHHRLAQDHQDERPEDALESWRRELPGQAARLQRGLPALRAGAWIAAIGVAYIVFW